MGAFFLAVNFVLYLRYPRLIRGFWRKRRRLPNIALPRRVDDKFLWRKIFDHNPLFTVVSDKLAAKAYVRKQCPGLPCARVLWSGEDPRDIPDQVLAGNVVVKANHGCGYNRMIFDGVVDRLQLEQEAQAWLGEIWGQDKGEWAYRNIRPRLFVEEMLCTGGAPVGREFKFHVVGGKVVNSFYFMDRFGADFRVSNLDRDGAPLPPLDTAGYKMVETAPPATYRQAQQIAEHLGKAFDYIRCDLYEVDGALYFGELTVYPRSGFPWIGHRTIEHQWTEIWDLQCSWFLSTAQQGVRGFYARRLQSALDASGGRPVPVWA